MTSKRSRNGKYILKYRKPIPCNDLGKWAKWIEKNDRKRKIRRTFIGDRSVSTVFLCFDHNYTGGTPELFETKIFGEDFEIGSMVRRYASHREALAGHWEAVAYLKQRLHEKRQHEQKRP